MVEPGRRLRISLALIGFILLLVNHIAFPESIKWNQDANDITLNANALKRMGDILPNWRIKQITWPSVTEINSKSVQVGKELKTSCIAWLSKFMNKEYLPAELEKNLVAMKNWGLIRKESEQKRLCDVFITRFRRGPYVIHIQESPYNVVIAVADERLAKETRANHKDLVVETATSVLNQNLKPNPDSNDLHVFEVIRDGHKLSKILWIINSVINR
ncbi:MAG: hypothetical protein J7M40_20055 [Planctomycetes bacterium]|nr:hypothetical protein [Planctomycetota bacterium]